MANERIRLKRLIKEELSKSDVNSMISSKMDSKEFERKVKEITTAVVSNLFKVLWQRNNLWKSAVKQ